MTAPGCFANVVETEATIEPLGRRVARVDQQAHGQLQRARLLLHSLQQLRGDAATLIGGQHGQAIHIEFACLCLVGHAGMVAPKSSPSTIDKGLA